MLHLGQKRRRSYGVQLADLAESGRGLQLVQGLTHRWGAEPQKRGKLVWFELDQAA
ncbi:ATP-binding protein [Kitasatospora purpeofusca]|uniref:ATP-binding protein n=1 Tax=Kitasatospora purpeofusca TaxID=67352 RepID=UPI002A599336|nr:ATP-binding protein [Kitasatospora purpeofusca]MDY0810292.1 ATP-binding protein [Kitasatospora purpeofusca]